MIGRMPDYSGFTRRGPQLYEFRRRIWDLTIQKWKLHNQTPVEEVVEALDPSLFWRLRWQLLHEHLHAFSQDDEFESCWEHFRRAFDPELLPANQICRTRLQQCNQLMQFAADVRKEALRPLREALRRAAYGVFPQEEINFLLAKHPKVVDMACGWGQLLTTINQQGGHAIGIDNSSIIWGSGHKRIRKLMEQETLIIGGPELLKNFPDFTLDMNWLEPGTSYPYEALEAFDGRYFVMKFGVFVDWLTLKDLKDIGPNAASNILKFLTILARDWREVSPGDRPEYNPWALYDNMWVFERKNVSVAEPPGD